MSENKLVSLMSYANLCLHEELVSRAARAGELEDRLRMNTLGAGHFARFAEHAGTLKTMKARFEPIAGPINEFGRLTDPKDDVEAMLRVCLVVGFMADLVKAVEQNLSNKDKDALNVSTQLWRSHDFASSKVVSSLDDEGAVDVLSLYGRRVISELTLTVQSLAAADQELSNILSGTKDDGLADIAGVSNLMDQLLEKARSRMRHLGLRA
ncbi:ferritin-like fold-containing protein [Propionimicrobium lymphophilum]|uniref:ferritin-like fold-containing protein n=1 Tax=Propionimicrobium lymphophilum TaxID=33012 RepID=UPI002550FD15|nr:ferritin-like fold-containing protein [Propionimicrobium lymphophilum]MDK7709333.1 ferritin-like fold-containing protein [Propionimicrobium lymphophilum]MDK7733320.1 ferritin-like fold-containing protein [Propionimicrobium lymphophilum]